MDKHTLVAAERDIARPSPSREWVDKQRSMRTSLRGGGMMGWSLVRAKSSEELATAGSRENPVEFVHCQCMFVHCLWL